MPKKQPLKQTAFIETMDCLPVSKLPEGLGWTYEIKLDGYRIEVVRTGGETMLYSRRQNLFNQKFHYIAAALKGLPEGTVIDGELVALGPNGRPDFNLLQNFRSAESRITYYAFDILVYKNRHVIELPLSERRAILRTVIKPGEHVALCEVSDRQPRCWNSSRATASKASWRSARIAPISQASEQRYGASIGSSGWWLRTQPSRRGFLCGGLLPR